MSATQKWLAFTAGSYVLGLIAYWMVSPYLAVAVPAVGMFGALIWGGRARKKIADAQPREPQLQQGEEGQAPPQLQQGQPNAGTRPVNERSQPVEQQQKVASFAPPQPEAPPMDPELSAALEYIGVIEDMILLEGEKNNLDNEIVEKTLALLARLNRLLPNLAALGDANINHNILRLVRKDLNSTINPFLRLSGEAKRLNRRLLLDGVKDIDSKLTFYTKTIEQKDLMELRTKAELIQQRYRLND